MAARACYDLEAHGHSDWFLPAKEELTMLALHADEIGGFDSDRYWSSTEYMGHGAWSQRFAPGHNAPLTAVKSETRAVRCIRR